MSTVVVKYCAGNIRSVLFALERLGIEAVLSDDRELIESADRVIFPGVGEASSTMKHLKSTDLTETILNLKKPVLAVCLGLQLLCEFSEEGDAECMGIFTARASRFPLKSVRVPHIGWSPVYNLNGPLFRGIPSGSLFYFVHSYFVLPHKNTIARCFHGEEFSAGLQNKNFFAVQFHPEKSGASGEQILKNFIEL